MLTFIFLIGFLVVSVVHLKHLDAKDQSLRNFTKPLLMSFLAFFYIFAVPDSGITNIIVFMGILACCAGDTFLMLEDVVKDGFLYGMLGFAVGHLFYMLAVLIVLPLNWSMGKIILLLPVIYIILKSFPKYRKELKDMAKYVYIYIGIALLLNFVIVLGVNMAQPSTFLLYIGSVFFIFSDSLLAMIDFGKVKVQNGRLYIMTTYIFSQFLIASGMLFY